MNKIISGYHQPCQIKVTVVNFHKGTTEIQSWLIIQGEFNRDLQHPTMKCHREQQNWPCPDLIVRECEIVGPLDTLGYCPKTFALIWTISLRNLHYPNWKLILSVTKTIPPIHAWLAWPSLESWDPCRILNNVQLVSKQINK